MRRVQLHRGSYHLGTYVGVDGSQKELGRCDRTHDTELRMLGNHCVPVEALIQSLFRSNWIVPMKREYLTRFYHHHESSRRHDVRLGTRWDLAATS